MDRSTGANRGVGRRRVRITRERGQSLVITDIFGASPLDAAHTIEVRLADIGDNGEAVVELTIPEHIFVERKERLDHVHAIFALRPAPG